MANVTLKGCVGLAAAALVSSMSLSACFIFPPSGLTNEMCNPRKTVIYPAYAEELPEKESPFYPLVEAEGFYNKKEYDKAAALLDNIIEKNEAKAKQQQETLSEPPWESKARIFSYKELNAVGTALVIKGLIYYQKGDLPMAEKIFTKQVSDYGYAQAWNPKGWFVKPAYVSLALLDKIRLAKANDRR